MTFHDIPAPRIPDPPVTHPVVNATTGMVWAQSSLVTLACGCPALVGAIASVGDRAPCVSHRAPMCITSVTPLTDIPVLIPRP